MWCGVVWYIVTCGAVMLFYGWFWCGFYGLVNTPTQIYTYVCLGLDKEGWYVGLSLGEIVHNWIWALGKDGPSLQLSGFGLGWKSQSALIFKVWVDV